MSEAKGDFRVSLPRGLAFLRARALGSFTTRKGAFTNDVIILGGGGLEKMTGRGCWAKDDVTFLI